MSNPFTDKALNTVAEVEHMDPDDLYIVWFCKTLGNWKALISTDTAHGLYWEVTYNGAKKETYVDRYIKVHNEAVPDTGE